MAISGEDLIEKADGTGGELLLAMFPGKTRGQVITLLDGYVGFGVAAATGLNRSDADIDQAGRSYGNWQGYERRLSELAGTGSASKSLAGQFAVQTTGDQFRELRTKADRWKAEYEKIVPPETAANAAPTILPSRTTAVRTTW